MSVIHAPRRPELDARLLVFPAILAPLLLGLFLRLWYLQVVEAADLSERAESAGERPIPKLAPRGLLYDRQGKLLAGIKPELVVTAVPRIVRRHPESLARVADILRVDVETLLDKLDRASPASYLPVPIAVGAPIAAGTRIAEAGDELPGIAIETKPLRWYPDTVSFTHVLGYTKLPSDKDNERLRAAHLVPSEYVGAGGVERAYERELMGRTGSEILEVDAKGRPLRVSGREAALPGERLELSIDADLQKFAYSTLGRAGMRGACVAIEPSTGEVLAMVSAPSYDLRIFEGGASRKAYAALDANEGKPFLNRATATKMAPGSTFKIVTSIAAMRSGRDLASFGAYCNGGYKIGNHTLKCLGHHGAIGFTSAMAKSCNTYFCTLGHAVGAEMLRSTALDCGLGRRTDIEIGDMMGDIPTPKWLKVYRHPWYPGDTINMSVGQGYVTATPLQMANLAALVGNEGTAYRPHLLHGVRNAKGKLARAKPQVAHRIEGPASFWRTLKGGLGAVISSGTGKYAQIPGVVWGGKTGSAEHGTRAQIASGKTHAWFVGFAPLDHPKIAICVFAEGAGHGGDFAAPLAGEIVGHYLAEESLRKSAAARSKSAAAPSSSRRS